MEKRAPFLERFWSRVDKSGECWVWKGSTATGGYGTIDRMRAHRVSWELANRGTIPAGMFIDHICRNPSCVRPDHLRLATPKQNLENIAEIRANNTSGYRGVCWNKKSGYWQATVVHNYERHFLGFFDTAEEAGSAALKKRLELYTHNAVDRELVKKMKLIPKHVTHCGVPSPSRGGRPCSNRVRHPGDLCQVHIVREVVSS